MGRYLKRAGLAGVAACAVTAAFGVSSALADSVQSDGVDLAVNDTVQGALASGTSADLDAGSADISCPESTFDSTVTNAGGVGVNPVLQVAASALVFGDPSGNVCTDTIFGVDVTYAQSTAAVDGTVSTTAGTQPDGQVTFANQTVVVDVFSTSGYLCTYKNNGATTGALDAAAQTLTVTNAAVTRTAGSSCGSSGSFSATWDLSSATDPGTLGVADS